VRTKAWNPRFQGANWGIMMVKNGNEEAPECVEESKGRGNLWLELVGWDQPDRGSREGTSVQNVRYIPPQGSGAQIL